jgi:UDP-N-acetylmuramoylalanine--D-glutamate ligase
MNAQPHILVLGAGESGTGAALLAKRRGMGVFVSDNRPVKPEYRALLQQEGIDFEEGGHSAGLFDRVTEVVKSPGIPDTAPIVLQAAGAGIPVISEIEFAARFTDAQTVCITGSNGKTTTTSLIWHIMQGAGMDAGLAGNVGNSFARMVSERHHSHYALELSSFQLDGMYSFRAGIAVLLNITPDHLDRYDYNTEKYAASKLRIIQNQTPSDSFIWCADDEVSARLTEQMELKQQVYRYSLTQKGHEGAWMENNTIVFNIKGETFTMSIEELALQGKHNIHNSMAAGIATKLLGIRKETIRQCLSDFQNIEHRLEHVANIHGIEFINDSKATNINSAWWALESQQRPVIWIAGGVDKGNDYTKLYDVVKEKVKALVCLGTDNQKLIDAFTGIIPVITVTGTARDAVNTSYYLAEDGDVVLLAPACASFDLFENYEDRGRQFKAAVKEL